MSSFTVSRYHASAIIITTAASSSTTTNATVAVEIGMIRIIVIDECCAMGWQFEPTANLSVMSIVGHVIPGPEV